MDVSKSRVVQHIKTEMKYLFSLVIFTLLVQTNSIAQSVLEEVKRNLESIIIQESKDKELPAFSIVLVDRSGILMEAHNGSKTLDNLKDTVNSKTIYRTGSVGKTITDLAVLIAVQHNILDLDQDIRLYLPEFEPQNAFKTAVTLRHLIKHQSGLVREPPVGNYFDDSFPTLEETVNSLNSTSLLWEPGTKTKYSNAGLAVVGRVLEKAYEMDYERILDSLIFTPLAMKNSRVGFDSSITKDLAKGYMWFPEQKPWTAPQFDLGMKPAGDLYISIYDMASLMIGFLNPGKRLISDELFDQMWKPSLTSKSWQMDVGLGFSLRGKFDGQYQMARHGGAVYGYSTELAILPKEGLGVYAVATKDMSGTAQSIATWLLKAVLASRKGLRMPDYEIKDKSFSELPSKLKEYSISKDDTELNKFVGTYGPNHNPLKIYEHNGKLHALIEWFFLYPLTKIDNNTYRFPSWSLYRYETIKFHFINKTKASEVVIGNGKEGVHFKRTANENKN